MKFKSRIILTCFFVLIFVLCIKEYVSAFGHNFVFPAARRSAVSGYVYADPSNPGHLAWDYRFSMHTKVAAAQKGWIATSRWDMQDGTDTQCTGTYDDRGNFIVLNHTSNDGSEGTGLETWYFHLSNTGLMPTTGQYFHVGKNIANSGDTGCGQAHLHFATKDNNIPFDPYAGGTNWVGGVPQPMGFRDHNNNIQGPFALDNTKIRDMVST